MGGAVRVYEDLVVREGEGEDVRTIVDQPVERLETVGLPCRVALEAGGWEIVKRYVGLGLGIAIVPAFCAEARDGTRLGSRSVAHLFGQDKYGIVVKRGRPLSPAAQELVRLIDPHFPTELQGQPIGRPRKSAAQGD